MPPRKPKPKGNNLKMPITTPEDAMRKQRLPSITHHDIARGRDLLERLRNPLTERERRDARTARWEEIAKEARAKLFGVGPPSPRTPDNDEKADLIGDINKFIARCWSVGSETISLYIVITTREHFAGLVEYLPICAYQTRAITGAAVLEQAERFGLVYAESGLAPSERVNGVPTRSVRFALSDGHTSPLVASWGMPACTFSLECEFSPEDEDGAEVEAPHVLH